MQMPTPIPTQYVPHKQERHTEGIVAVATLTTPAYGGSILIPLAEAEEKVRRVMELMLKRQNVYRYYTFIWCLSIVLLAIFITSGFAGFFGPVTAAFGSIMSVAGFIGAYINWKEWDRKNAI